MNVFLKKIKKYLILFLLLIIFFVHLGVNLPKTKGPSIRIETDVPAEDFVVRCTWYSGMLSISGGHKFVSDKVAVIKSGETFECGYSVKGALLKSHASVSYEHPIYMNWSKDGVEVIDGVKVIKPITKLQRLDEQEAKFQNGFWGNTKTSGEKYYKSLTGCGLPYQYLDNYSKVKAVDYVRFESSYNEKIFECYKKYYSVISEYDPYTYSKLLKPEERVKNLWK